MDWIAAGVVVALVIVINREIIRFARQHFLCQHEWVGFAEEDLFDGTVHGAMACSRCKREVRP